MADLNLNISAITLNVNGLNVPIKTHRWLEDKNKNQLHGVYKRQTPM